MTWDGFLNFKITRLKAMISQTGGYRCKNGFCDFAKCCGKLLRRTAYPHKILKEHTVLDRETVTLTVKNLASLNLESKAFA
jgi:hypothetical protein